MRFCPCLECPHYSKATKYDRQCYYEPQCWEGWADTVVAILVILFARARGKLRARRDKA